MTFIKKPKIKKGNILSLGKLNSPVVKKTTTKKASIKKPVEEEIIVQQLGLDLGKLKEKKIVKKSSKKKMVEKNPIVKQAVEEEIIVEEVIKETPKKNIKSSKTILFTDIKKPEPLDIKYVWEIISFEVDNHNRVSKIVYDIIGNTTISGVVETSNCRNVLLVKDSNNNNPVETMDYRHLLEDQFMKYLKANISDRHLDHIKKVIKEKLEGNQIITKLHWNK